MCRKAIKKVSLLVMMLGFTSCSQSPEKNQIVSSKSSSINIESFYTYADSIRLESDADMHKFCETKCKFPDKKCAMLTTKDELAIAILMLKINRFFLLKGIKYPDITSVSRCSESARVIFEIFLCKSNSKNLDSDMLRVSAYSCISGNKKLLLNKRVLLLYKECRRMESRAMKTSY